MGCVRETPWFQARVSLCFFKSSHHETGEFARASRFRDCWPEQLRRGVWNWIATLFTPYAVELVCYDLRIASKHEVTLALARDTHSAQDAVDRELVKRYRPGQKREGLLVQLATGMQDTANRGRHDSRPAPLSAVPQRLTFPSDIWTVAELRWQELGYESFSAYITGLIRYDLLVGGPHASRTGDCRRS